MNKVNYSYTFYSNKILRILRLIRMFRRCIQILLLSLTSCCISWIRNPGLRIEIIFLNVGFVIYLYFLLRFSSSIVAEFNSTFSRELRRDLHPTFAPLGRKMFECLPPVLCMHSSLHHTTLIFTFTYVCLTLNYNSSFIVGKNVYGNSNI